MSKATLILVLVAIIGGGIYYSCQNCHKEPPKLNPEEWWGPASLKGREDKGVRPFQIKFSESLVKELKSRLSSHRPFVSPLEGAGFNYGFNSDALEPWLKYWGNQYNFTSRERWLNQYPQFKTNIQGLDIHFIRVKPNVPANVEVVPILLMHGWPGSVREFYEAIPLLTRQTYGYDFAFEVIVPSLPGYGFSEAAVRPGLGPAQASVIMRNLMHRLGFKKYYIQGGDWGAVLAATMSVMFPEDILGHHTNMAFVQNGCAALQTFLGSFFPSFFVEPELADRMYPMSNFFSYVLEEFGYFHLQATKPDTIGVGLSDSPAGLLAYILEKFSTWTVRDFKNLPDGGLSKKFSKDQLIDNLMFYWTTNSITTSMRFYAESMTSANRALDIGSFKVHVPTWALQAKHELFYQPPGILRSTYKNLVNVTVLQDGGHFLAFELPQLFAQDVFRAVKAFREIKKKEKTEL